jgi:cytochrome c oxidase assembly protein subunit 15
MTARSPALSAAPVSTAGAVVSPGRRACVFGLVGSILFLVFMGAQVKSHDAGLAVPDWPLAYGELWPRMVGGVFHEHWHRAIATGVGLLTIVAAFWTQRTDSRRWLRVMGWSLLGAVILQGLLGGLTVKQLLPPEVSATHATLAQTVLCLAAWFGYACSAEWGRVSSAAAPAPASAKDLGTARRAAAWAMGAVYLQLILGAWMRHTEAGLAVPFFPIDEEGRWVPEVVDAGVMVHMAHRSFAAVVLLLVLRAALAAGRAAPTLLLHAGGLAAIVLSQAFLGASVIWTERSPEITSVHVANGAFVLLLTWLLVLRLWRRETAGPAEGAA